MTETPRLFYYLIDLHYSQTASSFRFSIHMFYYLIDLHYSQTPFICSITSLTVLLPYRFTLFSNPRYKGKPTSMVLLPYRFTLFSNPFADGSVNTIVLLPYRFTLFSNTVIVLIVVAQFYYLIDLHYSQTQRGCRLYKLLFYYLIDLHYSQTQKKCIGINT